MIYSNKIFYESFGFGPGDILLPKEEVDRRKWSVIAVDQYTSEGTYWKNLSRFVGTAPSILHMVLPEYYLEREDVRERYSVIKKTMEAYLEQGIFDKLSDSFIYIEREQSEGGIRQGLLGVVDLEQYDYCAGSKAYIRSTEETVASRIPPRVQIRKEASIEFPHILILCDDEKNDLFETAKNACCETLYDFTLYGSNQRLVGHRIGEENKACIYNALYRLKKSRNGSFLFAVGDGNHSLATAKSLYEEKKKANVPEEELQKARYALCELVNIREKSMPFLPIHRLLTCDYNQLKRKADKLHGEQAYTFTCFTEGSVEILVLRDRPDLLPVAVAQRFIDTEAIPVDYIHDQRALEQLSKETGMTGMLMPDPQRDVLFNTVEALGVLPRKTFSLGAAVDKRYYFEGRIIR